MAEDDGPAAGQVVRWVSSGVRIIGPPTVLGALLFYFGYVSSRAQYAYFGIDVDTIGLSTQDYIMRSPQPLLVPLLVLALIGVALLLLDTTILRRIAAPAISAAESEDPSRRAAQLRGRAGYIDRIARATSILGLAVLTVGVVLLFTYTLFREWAFYNLVTPLLLAIGGGLAVYALRISNFARRLKAHQGAPATTGTGEAGAAPPYGDGSVLLRRIARMLVYFVIAVSVFWATATVAQWSGRGLAQGEARHLNRLPYVILDTKERLFLHSPGVEETILPASQGQTFHYRYRRLRLLIVGGGRMFLVPEEWSASDSTLVVPLNGTARVQFQFQNQAP